jgi:hypothetical protein
LFSTDTKGKKKIGMEKRKWNMIKNSIALNKVLSFFLYESKAFVALNSRVKKA